MATTKDQTISRIVIGFSILLVVGVVGYYLLAPDDQEEAAVTSQAAVVQQLQMDYRDSAQTASTKLKDMKAAKPAVAR
jgi:hypothetical protein